MCGIGESHGMLFSMAGESSDRAIGVRIAETRQQKDLRQEDFLTLLEARGVSWTRTTLSRIESGQRSLKATELFAVADALGMSADVLNPESGTLSYAIQRQSIRYREKKDDLRLVVEETEMARGNLEALLLMREIVAGNTRFVVHGTPGEFIETLMLAFAESLNEDNALRYLHDDLGIDHDEYVAQTGRSSPPEFGFEDVDYEVYQKLFTARFPDLRFTGENKGFSVEGLKVSE
jgi:transcriptional regulator with XRE-family HTH domain